MARRRLTPRFVNLQNRNWRHYVPRCEPLEDRLALGSWLMSIGTMGDGHGTTSPDRVSWHETDSSSTYLISYIPASGRGAGGGEGAISNSSAEPAFPNSVWEHSSLNSLSEDPAQDPWLDEKPPPPNYSPSPLAGEGWGEGLEPSHSQELPRLAFISEANLVSSRPLFQGTQAASPPGSPATSGTGGLLFKDIGADGHKALANQFLVAALLSSSDQTSLPSSIAESKADQTQSAQEALNKLPLDFEQNLSQQDHQVKFFSRAPGYTLYLTATEVVMVMQKEESGDRNQELTKEDPTKRADSSPSPLAGDFSPSPLVGEGRGGRSGGSESQEPTILHPSVLRMKFVGANPNPAIVGQTQLPGISNYFIGNDPSKWVTNVPHFGKVLFDEMYPGIDLVFYDSGIRQLEYDWIVSPGADPRAIRMDVQGAESLSLDENGNLVMRTAAGEMMQEAPVMYQEVGGERRPVEGQFVLGKGHEVGFTFGGHDATQPLVIDPLLNYSSFLGGSTPDGGYGIAVDGSGQAYVTGYTYSGDFPTTPGAFDTSLNGMDAFVTKLNAAGTNLVYSTYLGGNFSENCRGIAVDGSGQAYVIGRTASNDFPITPGAFDTTFNSSGNYDVFVAKLNAAGTSLVYSTYLGGNSDDRGYGIAVDGSGQVYVTGYTYSGDFPTTPGAFDTTSNGNYDVFVTKLNAAGTNLVYSTYLGGNSDDRGYGIAVDGSGQAYVTGYTYSGDFPTTPGAFDTTFNSPGLTDAFVTKLNAAGTNLAYSTYLAGNSEDVGYGIAVDGLGQAYLTGVTSSPNFPTTPGAFDTTINGPYDVFVTKLNAAGTNLGYSTYLGGNFSEYGFGIAVDGSGQAYLTGCTISGNFPTTPGAFDTTFNSSGKYDAFVTKLNAGGTNLVYSTYLGGSSTDDGFGIAVDGSGQAYVTGYTDSSNFPTTPGAFDTTFNSSGFTDAFVVKMELGIPLTADRLPSLPPRPTGS